MGVADYGTSTQGTYSYSSSEFSSWANFTKLVINGGASGSGMTIQQNLVDRNVYENGISGVYWAQDVPFVTQSGSKYYVQEEDNIWNFSTAYKKNPEMAGLIHPDLLGHCSSGGQPTYYGCVASPKQYNFSTTLPFEILMQTKTLVLKSGTYAGSSAIEFGIWVYHNNVLVKGQWFDEVAFNSTAGNSKPGFHVADKTDPWGNNYDAETVLCGPGGGQSQAITSISATISESYLSGGAFQSVPHAYSAGTNTAETVTGVRMSGSGLTGVASFGTDNLVQLW